MAASSLTNPFFTYQIPKMLLINLPRSTATFDFATRAVSVKATLLRSLVHRPGYNRAWPMTSPFQMVHGLLFGAHLSLGRIQPTAQKRSLLTCINATESSSTLKQSSRYADSLSLCFWFHDQMVLGSAFRPPS